jgi:hypothetical protein
MTTFRPHGAIPKVQWRHIFGAPEQVSDQNCGLRRLVYDIDGYQGCMNCRAIRTKCDEQKPECRRCVTRGVVCKPYAKKLRWVVEVLPTQTSTRDERSSLDYQRRHLQVDTGYHPVSYRLQSLPLAHSDHPLDPLDWPIFEHWMAMTVQLVCLDPASSHNVRGMYFHLATNNSTVALRTMLANSAAHLLSLGRISDSNFALAQQKAFKALRFSLNNVPTDSKMLTGGKVLSHDQHMPLPSLADDTIVGSMLLLGDEIIQPGENYGLARVQYLLQGTYSLIIERYKYFDCSCPLAHPARSEPEFKLDSPLFESSVRLLAWGDIMSCVPCVRPPMMDKRYWLEGAIRASREGARELRPDFDLGYCAQIVALLGQCATAIYSLYTQSISEQEFSHMQDLLYLQLDKAMVDLPKPEYNSRDTPNHNPSSTPSGYSRSDMVEAHNSCITAAVCHGLASQILLLRAMDYERSSPRIQALCHSLSRSITQISTNSSVITIMLWPLWVLGCESYCSDGADDLRQFVTTFLQATYERQSMRSVEKCLVTLKETIWTLDPPPTNQEDKDYGPTQQSTWVRHCWNQGVRLLLA